ncbi:MAG: ABC transporter permease [Prevotellaceae bacterium]|jgi:lipoprotein-releasing system permease protein/zinc transport system substrate-binding protein|nr:ABC transporter permease [Prevotellaceae bacterium]
MPFTLHRLPFFIARRYLFAGKSHNVINIISMISVFGIAVGTLALVVVLSVYNGFDRLVVSLYHTFDADLRITPVEGKVFSPHTAAFREVQALAGIASYAEVLEENVLLEYRGKQDIVTLKGVDSVFEAATQLHAAMVHGTFALYHGEIEQAVVGRNIANKLRIGIHLLDPLDIYLPRRNSRISLTNPMASLKNDYLYPAGIFAVEQSFDSKYVFVPLAFVRRLADYTDEASAIELQLQDGTDALRMAKQIRQLLGGAFEVKDRYQQNEAVYAMMRSEKAMIYAILMFIIVIISCNVLGSLTMLIIEKKDDVRTLQSMGAGSRLISRIFLLEGWMISLTGVAAGVAGGLLVCFLQQQFGFVSLPGNFLVDAYPVVVMWTDVLWVSLSVAAIGFAAALLPVRYIK